MLDNLRRSSLKFLPVFLSVFFFMSCCWATADQKSSGDIQTKLQKENYSIGYQLGIGMKYDRVEVDVDTLVKGLLDGLEGAEPLIAKEQIQEHILDIKKASREAKLRERQELMVKNGQKAREFLTRNAEKVNIRTTESGLQYKILKEGEGPSPTVYDYVKVHYRGMFPDGTEFDSSYKKGQPQIFQTDGVIKGWTEALQMMNVNSKWQLFVPPELAYGRGGLEGTIPPNQVLIFEIELISFGPTGTEGQDG